MARPKSDRLIGVKMPFVLEQGIIRQVSLSNAALRVRRPNAPLKTKSDWIKETCEWRLAFMAGLSLGYYALRDILETRQAKSGCTKV